MVTEPSAAPQDVQAEALRRLEFLSDASGLLVSSLDPEEMLRGLTRLAVPLLADWCIVDLVQDDMTTAKRIAVHHGDPTKQSLTEAIAIRAHYDVEPDASFGLPKVLRTGQSEMASSIPSGWSEHVSGAPGYLDHLRAMGFQSFMCVPLVARGRILGALTFVMGDSGRSYSRTDLAMAEDLARRAAIAIDNARLYAERSYVAQVLQQSLLPPHLPEIPGLDVAARYHPAGEGNEVGGDFYDLFETAREDWAVVIGDVCGKGAKAAALTALARYTLRAAAMQARKPSRVLNQLNEALLRQGDGARFCTVAYGRIRRTQRGEIRLTIGAGGHPLPYVLRHDGQVQPVGKPGTLLGVFPDIAVADKVVMLNPGDVVVMYTDGVTEAGRPGPLFGDSGLRDLLSSLAGADAETIASSVEQAALGCVDGPARDDIAVVAIKVREPASS